MTTMQVSQRINLREVDVTDFELARWIQITRERMPYSLRDVSAGKWLGLYYDGQIYAAMRYVHRDDQSVFIDGLLCRPTKLGRKYAVALWLTMQKVWEGRRISFCVALNNRKLLNALTQYTNAKPVAAVFEVEA